MYKTRKFEFYIRFILSNVQFYKRDTLRLHVETVEKHFERRGQSDNVTQCCSGVSEMHGLLFVRITGRDECKSETGQCRRTAARPSRFACTRICRAFVSTTIASNT